ncbi:MAG: D-glutamate cyclase family protein [bacterium]
MNENPSTGRIQEPGITHANLSPQKLREMIREGEWRYRDTAGLAGGYLQAGFVCLPKKYAFDFFLFCQRNPAPQPLLEVLEPGETEPKELAPGADIRTDVSGYRVWHNGEIVSVVPNIVDYWRDDLVTFFSGGSFSFDADLLAAGVELRHVQKTEQIGTYGTNIPCRPAGIFSGPLVVSMRPIPWQYVVPAVEITSQLPEGHGAPVWIGDPKSIGVDLDHPFTGTGLSVREDEVPVFWACGDTALLAAKLAKVDFMLSYVDAGVFVTDIPLPAGKRSHWPWIRRSSNQVTG